MASESEVGSPSPTFRRRRSERWGTSGGMGAALTPWRTRAPQRPIGLHCSRLKRYPPGGAAIWSTPSPPTPNAARGARSPMSARRKRPARVSAEYPSWASSQRGLRRGVHSTFGHPASHLFPTRDESIPQEELFKSPSPWQAHGEGGSLVKGRGEASSIMLRKAFVSWGQKKGIRQGPEAGYGLCRAQISGVPQPTTPWVFEKGVRVRPFSGTLWIHGRKSPGKGLLRCSRPETTRGSSSAGSQPKSPAERQSLPTYSSHRSPVLSAPLGRSVR